MCDVGKGVTRMLTPSRQQIEFVQAVSPIAVEAIRATSLPGGGTMRTGGGTLDSLLDGSAMWGGYGSALTPQQKKANTTTLVVAGAAVVAAAILLWPK